MYARSAFLAGVIMVNPLTSSGEGVVGDAQTWGCEFDVTRAAVLGNVDDAFSLTQPTRLDVSPLPGGDGWIVVDAEARFVASYSPAGELRGRLLPLGQGPGEIESPVRAFLDETDSLWVSEVRGRAVIVGADGAGSRTLTADTYVPADGDTPSGLLYSVRVVPELTREGGFGATHRRAEVMTREGRPAFHVGPAVTVPAQRLTPMSFELMRPFRLMAEGDSAFLAPSVGSDDDVDLWLTRWTADGVEPLMSTATVREFLESRPGRSPPSPGRSRYIRRGPGGMVWLLGTLQEAPEMDADAIRQEVADSRELDPTDSFLLYHPDILNRTNPGLLLLATPDGRIIDGEALPHYPRGFVDDSHLYSLQEDEFGLLQVVIWRFRWTCDEGGQS